MQNKLNFCRYYNNEEECPYKRGYKRIVWESEKHVCETEDNARDASEFLHLVASAIGENDKETIARYIAQYDCYRSSIDNSIANAKKYICEFYKLQDILFFDKPLGQTIYESIDEGTYEPECEGTILYEDGRIYKMYGYRINENCTYLLEAINKPFADDIKSFIEENWNIVQKLPSETSKAPYCDGSYQYYKFLNKQCHGYMMRHTDDGQEVFSFAQRIDYLFHYCIFQTNEFETDEFVKCWDAFMDMVISDKKGEKILDFICYGCFAEDCEVLGFNMDCFESFNKKYGNDFFNKYGDEKLERVFSLIDDYQILGNAIYSQWRYYNHWAYDPIAEFDANWFKAAFKRLKELWEKQE